MMLYWFRICFRWCNWFTESKRVERRVNVEVWQSKYGCLKVNQAARGFYILDVAGNLECAVEG